VIRRAVVKEPWILPFASSDRCARPRAVSLAGSGRRAVPTQRLAAGQPGFGRARSLQSAANSRAPAGCAPTLEATGSNASRVHPRAMSESPRMASKSHRQPTAAECVAPDEISRSRLQPLAAGRRGSGAAPSIPVRSFGRRELPGNGGSQVNSHRPLDRVESGAVRRDRLITTSPRCSAHSCPLRARVANNIHSPRFSPYSWQATTLSSSTSISQKPASL